jgi:hypothetical protein
MPQHAGYVLERLRENGEFTLYRGHEPSEAPSVLVVAPAAEQPSPQSLRQLEHECSLAADLDPAWAARPVEVTRRDGRTSQIAHHAHGQRSHAEGSRVGAGLCHRGRVRSRR